MSTSIRRRVGRIAPWCRRFKRNGYRRDKCHHCGHPFRWNRDARFANGNRDGKRYHGPCHAYLLWRLRAEQRLDVLAVVQEVTGVTAEDLRTVMSLRDGNDGWNRAWRVFYDLEKSTHAPATPATPTTEETP